MSTTHLNQSEATRGSVHLDAIRGAAALLVFANHTRACYFESILSSGDDAKVQSAAGTTQPAQPVKEYLGMPSGTVRFANEAVIVFFALSGYLVGGSVLRSLTAKRWSWKIYLSKRLTRLLVVLIPALLLGYALDRTGTAIFGPNSVYTAAIKPPLGQTEDLGTRLGWQVIAGNLAFLQTIFVPPLGTNISLWSLASEFWYYILFPFGAIACTSSFRPSTRLISGIAAVCTAVFVGWNVLSYFPIFVLGALLVRLPKRMTQPQITVATLGCVALLLCSMVTVRLARMEMVPALYVVGAATCLLLYVIVQNKLPAGRGLYRSLSGYFSHISYTLYLFHLPLVTFLCGYLNNPWHSWTRTPRNMGLWALSNLVVLAIVTGLWYAFESQTDKVREWIFPQADPAA